MLGWFRNKPRQTDNEVGVSFELADFLAGRNVPEHCQIVAAASHGLFPVCGKCDRFEFVAVTFELA
jgi:hypothetical protein